MKTAQSIILQTLIGFVFIASAAAHWSPADGHKMHYPQMPDPQGWDICLRPMAVADDFRCSQSGPVTEIHFWISWKDDIVDEVLAWHITICEDADGKPGAPLWKYKDGKIALRDEAPSSQGWICPSNTASEASVLPDNHTRYSQVNITDIQDPFIQTEGKRYWLVIHAYGTQTVFAPTQSEAGWKTSKDHFGAPAMWSRWPLGIAVGWTPIPSPTQFPLDMAFVINGRSTPPPPMDFGDADETKCDDATVKCNGYPTTLARNGARHVIVPGVFMGSPMLTVIQIDAEKDGRPSPLCDGDDLNGIDDEQAVQLPEALVPGTLATAGISVSTDGFIDAWVDFNADGDWDDWGERIFYSKPVTQGFNTLTFTVPPTSNDGQPRKTYSRFRFSTEGRLNYFGPAKDGEVEDYLVTIKPDPQPRLDFGDCPDGDFAASGYPTLRLTNGARHRIVPGVCLGRLIDGEWDGLVSGAADGDDLADTDDEDGVYFIHPMIPGNLSEVRVIASVDGCLNAWVDFNADGDWDDAGERIFTARKLAAGVNDLKFPVPVSESAQPLTTFARFRFTSADNTKDALIGYAGLAEDGEVEDYQVKIQSPQPVFDFGDAPELRCDDPAIARCNAYPTTLARNGARHIVQGGIYLGHPYTDVIHIDAEPDGQPTLKADGDDQNGVDDEDGVEFLTPLIPGHPAKVQVMTSADGFIDAWIDFNRDGDWDDFGEQIFASEKVPLGINELEFKVPPHPHAIATNAGTYARFRFSTHGQLRYSGPARDGEVEDYLVRIEQPDRSADLGDAPDSTNHHDLPMTAYPAISSDARPVPAHYPTVYRPSQLFVGPIHWMPQAAHLGPRFSLENEADFGWDEDATNNLIPPKDAADLDGADDGVRIPLTLPHCRRSWFDYIVRVNHPVKELYVNVWFDWNRDGDWDDTLPCGPRTTLTDEPERAAQEWAVANQVLALPAGIHRVTTPPFISWHPLSPDRRVQPIWMRITLSEKPWSPPPIMAPFTVGIGGCGPMDGYWLGETEDYFFTPILRRIEPADLDGDTVVDLNDLSILASQWMMSIETNTTP